MKNKKKIGISAVVCAAVIGTSALSYGYASTLPVVDEYTDVSENISETYQADVPAVAAAAAESIEYYELNISEFEGLAKSNSSTVSTVSSNTLSVDNNYGTFTVKASNGKVKKYKYGDNDTSKKYLINGTAKFKKKDITFDGYFLVDETLSGYKKGQVMLYNGKLTLPNGDKYDGYISSGKYYSSGTYTWKDGNSFKGKFTTSNKMGTSKLGENVKSEYGYFYFDKSKKTYLYIRFVNSVPRETGYFVDNGTKYTVKFDSNGVCTYTAVKE